jgi:hypothetical protein
LFLILRVRSGETDHKTIFNLKNNWRLWLLLICLKASYKQRKSASHPHKNEYHRTLQPLSSTIVRRLANLLQKKTICDCLNQYWWSRGHDCRWAFKE